MVSDETPNNVQMMSLREMSNKADHIFFSSLLVSVLLYRPDVVFWLCPLRRGCQFSMVTSILKFETAAIYAKTECPQFVSIVVLIFEQQKYFTA